MNRQAPLIVLTAVLLAAVTLTLVTVGVLPDQVATQFNLQAQPVGYMSRDAYTAFMLGMMLGMPMLIRLLTTWLPARWPRLVNLPNRDYWLAPKRREESIAFLGRHCLWLAALIVAFFASVHGLILDANSQLFPRLDNGSLALQLGSFLVALVAWSWALRSHFSLPSD